MPAKTKLKEIMRVALIQSDSVSAESPKAEQRGTAMISRITVPKIISASVYPTPYLIPSEIRFLSRGNSVAETESGEENKLLNFVIQSVSCNQGFVYVHKHDIYTVSHY